jgi:hypothetical protein
MQSYDNFNMSCCSLCHVKMNTIAKHNVTLRISIAQKISFLSQ